MENLKYIQVCIPMVFLDHPCLARTFSNLSQGSTSHNYETLCKMFYRSWFNVRKYRDIGSVPWIQSRYWVENTVKSITWAASNSRTQMYLVSCCSFLCPIYWSHGLSREWRCIWCNAAQLHLSDEHIIAFWGSAYIRGLTVHYASLTEPCCMP